MKKTLVVGFLAVLVISLLVLPSVGRVLDDRYGSGGSHYRSLPAYIQFDWEKSAGESGPAWGGTGSAGDPDRHGQGGNARMTPC